MSKRSIILLMSRRHKLLDPINREYVRSNEYDNRKTSTRG
jgi:hypothetical protein